MTEEKGRRMEERDRKGGKERREWRGRLGGEVAGETTEVLKSNSSPDLVLTLKQVLAAISSNGMGVNI